MGNGEVSLLRPAPHSIKWNHHGTVTETALEMYEIWAAELGVPDAGTDHAYDETSTIPLNQSFYHGLGGGGYVYYDRYGSVQFYVEATAPSGTPTQVIVSGHTANILDSGTYPAVILKVVDSQPRGSLMSMADFRVRESNNVTIMYVSGISGYSCYGSKTVQTSVAIKIQNGFVEIYSYNLAQDSRCVDGSLDFSINPCTVDTVNSDNIIGDNTTQATNHMDFALESYKVSGVVVESLDLTKFDVQVHNSETGYLVHKETVDTQSSNNFELFFALPNPVAVTVTPLASKWIAGKPIAIGDVVYPTDPSITPYYYRATGGGTTDTAEPVWPTSAGTVNDNDVTWEFVEQMAQPVTNAPLIPVLVE